MSKNPKDESEPYSDENIAFSMRTTRTKYETRAKLQFDVGNLGSVFYHQNDSTSKDSDQEINFLSENGIVILHSTEKNIFALVEEGASMDNGAERIVIGINQASAYWFLLQYHLSLTEVKENIVLDKKVHILIGYITVWIPIRSREVIMHAVEIVHVNVLFFIGLDKLKKYTMYAENVPDKLCIPLLHTKVPLTRRDEHIYLEWKKENAILLTTDERMKLYRGFLHKSNDKLLNLLLLATPLEVVANVTKIEGQRFVGKSESQASRIFIG